MNIRNNTPKQSTYHLLMVRPSRFESNQETCSNNFFQLKSSSQDVPKKALEEFDAYVKLLMKHGIQVSVIQDNDDPHKPDSIFPNNWFSTHSSGELVYYPMFAPNRRKERTDTIKAYLEGQPGVKRVIDLSHYEENGEFLEGTGSLVLDRENKILYACKSVRTSETVLEDFCKEIGYEAILFHGVDEQNMPIYHSNVMMGVCSEFSIICLDAIKNPQERSLVVNKLESTGHEIVDISQEQVRSFAGNNLEVRNLNGETFCLMSDAGYRSLRPEQKQIVEKYASFIHPKLHTIETNGGGSARCMVAELFTY